LVSVLDLDPYSRSGRSQGISIRNQIDAATGARRGDVRHVIAHSSKELRDDVLEVVGAESGACCSLPDAPGQETSGVSWAALRGAIISVTAVFGVPIVY
jgi:hypothetical protein